METNQHMAIGNPSSSRTQGSSSKFPYGIIGSNSRHYNLGYNVCGFLKVLGHSVVDPFDGTGEGTSQKGLTMKGIKNTILQSRIATCNFV
jgi:hypothetical protein